MKSLLQKVFWDVLGPIPKFRTGDAVRSRGQYNLMYITSAERQGRKVIYVCRWYDHSYKASRTSSFEEDELDNFDWDIADGNTGIRKSGDEVI